MSEIVSGFEYLIDNFDEFLTLLQQHIALVLVSELAAIAVAIPASILAVRNARARRVVLGVGNVAQTIPTLAIIALVFPLIGIGFWPSVIGLWAYAILPIITNTISGIENVSDDTVEAARGMGMTDWEVLRKIQVPLALPVIFAGIRTSIVLNVGTAYLAFFIGGGGLGLWVVGGIQLYNMPQVLAGAIPGALLAIGADLVFARIQRRLGGESDVNNPTAGAA
ncbi:ABC transporter permease [Natronorubrum thiooxidans]|uniref:Osmoprotectant transport system permease protein n=1 Tax=Natronorubrum thiooxidans TaxID=308853 RepID=A0A1N7H3W2_9EURY|nr:ABC transporter permease [Natronorubrum thiooxidans]SIS19534.1 osmoprotectant transport system permease protein [Natronorubrum thiooxidans]